MTCTRPAPGTLKAIVILVPGTKAGTASQSSLPAPTFQTRSLAHTHARRVRTSPGKAHAATEHAHAQTDAGRTKAANRPERSRRTRSAARCHLVGWGRAASVSFASIPPAPLPAPGAVAAEETAAVVAAGLNTQFAAVAKLADLGTEPPAAELPAAEPAVPKEPSENPRAPLRPHCPATSGLEVTPPYLAAVRRGHGRRRRGATRLRRVQGGACGGSRGWPRAPRA